MGTKINLLRIIGSQWKTILKKHLIPELGAPVLIGVGVALLSSVVVKFHSIMSAVITVIILIPVSVIVYLVITVKRLITISTKPVVSYNYADLIHGTQEFFCTSVIPPILKDFATWFTSEIVESFSFIVKERLGNPNYKACRVLIFVDKNQPEILRAINFFDGSYARRVANIHKNAEIELAFLTYEDFLESCKDIITRKDERDPKEFDMAIFANRGSNNILAAKEDSKKEISYSLLQNQEEKQKCDLIMQALKNQIFDTTTGTLKSEYDFHSFLAT